MLEESRSGTLLCAVQVALWGSAPHGGGCSLCCVFIRGGNYNLCLFISSEDQDELHYQDTDSDVPEQRDGRCKVKWTQEEVSESPALAESECFGIGFWHGTWGLGTSTPDFICWPRYHLLLEKTMCLFCSRELRFRGV